MPVHFIINVIRLACAGVDASSVFASHIYARGDACSKACGNTCGDKCGDTCSEGWWYGTPTSTDAGSGDTCSEGWWYGAPISTNAGCGDERNDDVGERDDVVEHDDVGERGNGDIDTCGDSDAPGKADDDCAVDNGNDDGRHKCGSNETDAWGEPRCRQPGA